MLTSLRPLIIRTLGEDRRLTAVLRGSALVMATQVLGIALAYAMQVVIATGYATRYLRPLAGRFRLRHTYVLSTNRIGMRARRRIGLGPVMLWDTARPYHYVRWTRDHRLLLGGEDHPVKPGARRALGGCVKNMGPAMAMR